jgi:hypothetical protein
MKTRKGFVSNSSSSSFCILGISREDLITSLGKDVDDDRIKSLLENEFYIQNGISEYSEDDFFIGLPPGRIDEDKTIKETKDEIVAILNRKLGNYLLPGKKIIRENLAFYIDGGYL